MPIHEIALLTREGIRDFRAAVKEDFDWVPDSAFSAQCWETSHAYLAAWLDLLEKRQSMTSDGYNQHEQAQVRIILNQLYGTENESTAALLHRLRREQVASGMTGYTAFLHRQGVLGDQGEVNYVEYDRVRARMGEEYRQQVAPLGVDADHEIALFEHSVKSELLLETIRYVEEAFRHQVECRTTGDPFMGGGFSIS